MFPIYIPSRGRAKTATTPACLDAAHLSYALVVEPLEYLDYREAFPQATILTLPASGQGVSFARNWILDDESGWHWMIDDDIEQFYVYRTDGFYEPCSADILVKISEMIEPYREIVQVSLGNKRRKQHAKPWYWNVGAAGVVCNYAPTIQKVAHYRTQVPEDTDMSLQVLSAGYYTLRCGYFCYSTPECASNLGGQHEVYQTEAREVWARNMMQYWGSGLIHLHQMQGFMRIAPRWHLFKAPGRFC